MVVEYIRYKIEQERQEAFFSAYQRAQEALKASPNCLGYELTHCTEEPERYILRIEWDSIEGHLKEFRGSPEFQRFLGDVRPFINDIEEMQHYKLTDITLQK